MYSTDFNKIKFSRYDVQTLEHLLNLKKYVPLLPWELWPSLFEVQKNYSLALIIEILYLKQNIFEIDNCLLALTTSTSHMESCFKIDLGLIKLSNV